MKSSFIIFNLLFTFISLAQPQNPNPVVQVANTVKVATPDKSQNNLAAPSQSALPKTGITQRTITTGATQPSAANIPGTTAPPALDSPIDSLLNEDLIRSLRDPFQLPSILAVIKESPKSDLEVFPLKDLKLNGIITGPKKTRAMITTPGNKVFFVRIGDRIGVREGKVTQINADSIKVIEYFVDDRGKKTPDVFELTMSGDVVSLSKRESL